MALFKNIIRTSGAFEVRQTVKNYPNKWKLRKNLISSYTNIEDLDAMEKNVVLRKHRNNIPAIRTMLLELDEHPTKIETLKRIEFELFNLPNSTNKRLLSYGDKALQIHQNHVQLPEKHDFSTTSYYLLGDLAALEQSLLRFSVDYLKQINFRLISVPDILTSYTLNACGMQTEGNRNQVYKLQSGECLSGTSEMALAGLFSGEVFEESKLPLKVAAVSRCYRAETSGLHEEKGIYRVHQFTKVEMFSVCSQNQSEAVVDGFKSVQMSLYEQLNLLFRVLDMPPIELGASAFEKYDIEAWLSGRQMWGEVSSCSNCTDYQAKRLNIKYRTKSGNLEYAHTVNGTAAAIPRLLIALVESNKIGNGVISIPEGLKWVLKANFLKRNSLFPAIKLIKYFNR